MWKQVNTKVYHYICAKCLSTIFDRDWENEKGEKRHSRECRLDCKETVPPPKESD
jgi:hypothetical protein